VAEVDEVLGSRRYVTSEDLAKLTYLDQALKEALRLHPPQPAINRITTEETKLGDYVVPAGTSIMCDAHVLHHNPKYWNDPDKFDPDRFSPENKSKVTLNFLSKSHALALDLVNLYPPDITTAQRLQSFIS